LQLLSFMPAYSLLAFSFASFPSVRVPTAHFVLES
jgi:hypothetical protein